MQNTEVTSNMNLAWYHLKSLQTIAQKGKWPQELTSSDRKNLRKQGLVKNHYLSQKGWQPQLTPTGLDILTLLTGKTIQKSIEISSINKVIQSKTVK